MKTVWIITEEYNEYDQHGQYFIAWFSEKPTVEQITKCLDCDDNTAIHVANGGGRRVFGVRHEDQWYHLKEVKEG